MKKITVYDKNVKTYLRKELTAYMRVTGNLTVEETTDLLQWVSEGNSCHDNPYFLSDEYGRPIDFVRGCRIAADMYTYPSDYYWGEIDGACREEEIPF